MNDGIRVRGVSWRTDIARFVAAAAMLYVSLIVSACADANSAAPQAHEASDTIASSGVPSIETAKQKQLSNEQAVANRLPSASDMKMRRVRALTLRDSGIDGSMMFARDVDFRVTGEIGFQIHAMAASLAPARAGDPVVFDDPNSVTINVHRGDVTLDSAKLTAIFDRYLFQYQGSPLRNMRVVPELVSLSISMIRRNTTFTLSAARWLNHGPRWRRSSTITCSTMRRGR